MIPLVLDGAKIRQLDRRDHGVESAMSLQVAYLRFYAELNDFLPPEKQHITFAYHFKGTPAIKDALEAAGVPHTEVDLIITNGVSVAFDYRLCDGDRVAVYPVFESVDISPIIRLRPQPLRETKFILDVHLGKLARHLRMLGFDTLYRHDYQDPDIIAIALRERRIILTRDRGILKARAVTHGYWMRSTAPKQQVREVLQRFDLQRQIRPFHRCMRCNGLMQSVEKQTVLPRLLPKTARYYHEFYQCSACLQLYWKGPHHRKMQEFIQELARNARCNYRAWY
jgi:uncharacterized protein